VGLAVGAGFFVAEYLFSMRPSIELMGPRGLWREFGAALVLYAVAFALADTILLLLTRGLSPGWLRWRVWLRGLALLAAAASLGYALNNPISWLWLAGAGAFAACLAWRWTWPLAALASSVPLFEALPREPPAAAEPVGPPAQGPSIAVIVLDTVRWDHTSAYGYARDTTPALRALAERGVRFERAYSSGCWSLPAHASLFTSRLPSSHGAHDENFRLGREIPTLAEGLRNGGYETVALTANPWTSSVTGLSRGFMRFEEFWQGLVAQNGLLGFRLLARYTAIDRDKGGGQVVAAARGWLRARDGERPFFLFVNLMEAHAPYQAVPSNHRRRFVDPSWPLVTLEKFGEAVWAHQWEGRPVPPSLYEMNAGMLDGAISAADRYLGELLALLGEDTIVFVLSDHGDLAGEYDLFGHNFGLWEPLIRIPLVVAGPGFPRGAVVRETVSIVDVAPTVAGLAGIEFGPGAGVDLRTLLEPRDPSPPRAVTAEQFRVPGLLARGFGRFYSAEEVARLRQRRRAVVSGTSKRVWEETGRELVYDLAGDPDESDPREIAPATAALDTSPRAAPETVMSPEARQALRALGYVE
jgi:arylsulfatase A-like enzyme